jgi:serine phosphatase RsbU (regulator of sigma subunit)
MLKKLLFIFLLFPCVIFSQNPKIADSLLRLAHNSSSDTASVAFYCKLGLLSGTPEAKAKAWIDSAMILADKSGVIHYKAAATKAKGDVFHLKAENDSALHYYSEGLKLFSQSNELENVAMSEYAIANTLVSLDRMPEALNSYIECEKTAERAPSKKYQAYAKNGIGSVYFTMKNYPQSLKMHQEALEIAKDLNDNKLLGWTYTNLGNAEIVQNNYTEALKYFNLQLEAYLQTDFISGQAGAYNNIGVCNSYLKNYDEAIINYKKAYDIKEKSGTIEGLSTSMQNIAELYSLKGDQKTSLQYSYIALDWAKKASSISDQAQAYHQIAQAFANMNQFDSAYFNFTRFKDLNDSIYNSNTQNEISEMQAKYDNDKLQQKNSLLEKDNQIGRLYTYAISSIGLLVLLLALFAYNRYRIKNKANKLLAEQNEQITAQKKEITDSINYAKRIQQSILPSPSSFQKLLPQSFILYRPKDIVSGDFYWMEKVGGSILLAAVDCTGHGVPGAMMSVLGYNLLTEAVVERKLSKPSDVLASLNSGIIRALQRQSEDQVVKDGMDIALCAIDLDKMKLDYSGVYNPLYLVREGKLQIYEANRNALGLDEENVIFSNHTIELQKNDCVYIFTDGYADQFGGTEGKKFKYKQLQKILTENVSLEMETQKEKLESILDNWKGNLEQVDDILLIGFRI